MREVLLYFMTDIIKIIIAVVASAVVFGIVGFLLGQMHRKRVAEAEIGSATQEATRIVNNALAEAETKKKEAIIEAKDEIHKQRNELERELRERRSEVQRQERRIIQKEETLDRKIENLEKKDETLNKKLKDAQTRLDEVESIKRSQFEMLERISGFTQEQAKEYLLKNLEDDLTHEKAVKIMEFEQKTKDEADTLAREIVATAIQRCAADHAAEATVSVVSLPNDEMKGRIIGREGRNIRALETITGVDLIIDDTPEAITLSSFDPVRREIARVSLEKLITDGRIHPARIEDVVHKCEQELEVQIREVGEQATFDAGVHGIHPELVRFLGQLRYRTSFTQNVLQHSLEVSALCGMMAAELGMDIKKAKRAGLLHDIGKAVDHEVEGPHALIGADLAKKYNESKEILHAIAAHHEDQRPETALAVLVQAADSLSGARPGARKELLESYVKRLEDLENIASEFDGVSKAYAIQAGREIRVMVNSENVDDDQTYMLCKGITGKIEENLTYPGQIRVTVIRERRAVGYAK